MDSKVENEKVIVNPPEGEVLDQNTALNILVNAVHVGQARGAWKLEESEVLLRAIRVFIKKP